MYIDPSQHDLENLGAFWGRLCTSGSFILYSTPSNSLTLQIGRLVFLVLITNSCPRRMNYAPSGSLQKIEDTRIWLLWNLLHAGAARPRQAVR